MRKPSIGLDELVIGKMFQISPEGKDPVQVMYGGDFLISTEYLERGVRGYLASVLETEGTVRLDDGVAHALIDWKYLELVGEVNWYRKQKEENGKSDVDKEE